MLVISRDGHLPLASPCGFPALVKEMPKLRMSLEASRHLSRSGSGRRNWANTGNFDSSILSECWSRSDYYMY